MHAADRSRVGPLLRDWRQRRHMSQLELALEAGVSTRHLSFVETGRARPSAEMVVHLADQLDVPLRERNELLLAAGYAPAYGRRGLDEPDMEPVRDAIDRILAGHEPYPAVVVDRQWELLAANAATALLLEGVAPHLLEPPANVLRIALHPEGMLPRIVNAAEWRAHLLGRLAREAALTGDPSLASLHAELAATRASDDSVAATKRFEHSVAIAVPLRLRHGHGELAFISMITTFGTAADVTVAELSIESFFPADAATARALRK